MRRVGTSESTLPQAACRVNRDLGKVEKDCRQAAPKEKQIGQSANQTPWEGANQHDAVEDAQWFDQAGCGRGWGLSFARLSALDFPSHQWLRAGAHEKGTGAPGGAKEGCRRQAHRALRVGRTANQIDAMMPSTLDSGYSTLPLYRHAGAELFLGARPRRGSLKLGDRQSG